MKKFKYVSQTQRLNRTEMKLDEENQRDLAVIGVILFLNSADFMLFSIHYSK